MSVSFGMTPFDKLQWGDPALAQIAGSDAQAYADYPASGVLQTMSTGLEQAPGDAYTQLSTALNGTGVGTQTDTAPQTCGDCTGPTWVLRPCCWTYVNPFNLGNWTGENQKAGVGGGGVGVGAAGGANAKSLAVMIVVGLLAVGLVLLGVHAITEA